MSDTSNAFHAFGEDPDSSLGADNSARWMPTPWSEFAADLASTHPNLQVTGFIINGGMGAIYKAVDITDTERKPLAIKTLRWDELDNLELKARFQKEILTLRLLKHPHICELKEVGKDAIGDPVFSGETSSGVPFFVMPRYQGRTLEHYTQGPRLPVPRIRRLIEQLCSATAYAAENGVVHRDLKPANIFLVDPDESARILDYGVARTLSPAAGVFTRTGMIAGTVGYHAPEVLAGRPAGTTADVYSLGLIQYKLLTGALPEGIPIPVADHGHDPRFDPILAKAHRPDPADRYPSATAFWDALKVIAAPHATPPPLPQSTIPKWYADKRVLIPAVAMIVLSFAIASTGFKGTKDREINALSSQRTSPEIASSNQQQEIIERRRAEIELKQKSAFARIEGLERELSNQKELLAQYKQKISICLMDRRKFESEYKYAISYINTINKAKLISSDKTGKYTEKQKKGFFVVNA